jgi:hypothetical protein
MRRAILIAGAAVLLSACGEGHLPSATQAQVNAFLAACNVAGARVIPGGGNGTTDWIINFDTAARSDWDCLSQQSEAAGVLVTKTALKIDESA